MKITTDDDLRRIDSVFLGPKNFRFPFYWRYSRYYIFIPTAIVVATVGIYFGFPISTYTFAAWVGLSLLLTRIIESRLVPGFGVGPLIKSLWQEISAPRRESPKPSRYAIGGTVKVQHKKDYGE